METMPGRHALGGFSDGDLAGGGQVSLADDRPVEFTGEELTDDEFTDEELTALALAADPDAPIAPGAVRLDVFAKQPGGFLPEWYMPRVMAKKAQGWRVPAVYMIIAALLLIDAFGLCITYGQLGVA